MRFLHMHIEIIHSRAPLAVFADCKRTPVLNSRLMLLTLVPPPICLPSFWAEGFVRSRTACLRSNLSYARLGSSGLENHFALVVAKLPVLATPWVAVAVVLEMERQLLLITKFLLAAIVEDLESQCSLHPRWRTSRSCLSR